MRVTGRRPVRVGVIGVGQFGQLHIQAYLRIPGVEIVGVCDSDATRAIEAAARFGIEAHFDSAELLLDAMSPDAVSVCTAEDAHLSPSVAALERGVSLLVEKPIAPSLVEAEELAAAAKRSDAITVPGHILRFSPGYRGLHDRVRSGGVGDVLAIASRRDRTQALSRHYTRVHPAFLTLIHDIDQVVWLTKDRIARVRAIQIDTGSPQPSAVWAQLETAGGVLASISTAYMHPIESVPGISDRMDVYGSRGVASLDLSIPRLLVEAEQRSAPDLELTPDDGSGPLTSELMHFCDCVREGKPSDVVTMEEAIEGIRVAEAIVASANGNAAIVELAGA